MQMMLIYIICKMDFYKRLTVTILFDVKSYFIVVFKVKSSKHL